MANLLRVYLVNRIIAIENNPHKMGNIIKVYVSKAYFLLFSYWLYPRSIALYWFCTLISEREEGDLRQ